MEYMNQCPLDSDIDDDLDNNNNNNDGNIQDFTDDINIKSINKKSLCFWCFELAKKDGINVDELIKNNDIKTISHIFHQPINAKTGKLECKKLI
mmetsp:Transcript_101772/g.124574  ORF Transcript_101772/g.124574 Transcript_101772/m.124574 type:complete len:94 (-) Transcript_101772:68-349(-)